MAHRRWIAESDLGPAKVVEEIGADIAARALGDCAPEVERGTR
jgi:hypothetical protein